MKLGKKEEGRELYKKFLMFAYVLDGYCAINFETVRKEFVDTLYSLDFENLFTEGCSKNGGF